MGQKFSDTVRPAEDKAGDEVDEAEDEDEDVDGPPDPGTVLIILSLQYMSIYVPVHETIYTST